MPDFTKCGKCGKELGYIAEYLGHTHHEYTCAPAQQEFDWTRRIESEMSSIEWILRRNQDTGLFNKTYREIEAQIQKLIQDVQSVTREEK